MDTSRTVPGLLLGALLLVVSSGAAAGTDKEERQWSFSLAPYGWLAGVKGTIYTDGVRTELDVPVQDILDNTQSGFQLYARARYRRLYLAFDGTWATLGGKVDLPVGSLDVDIDQRIYDIRIGANVRDKALSEPDHKGRFKRTYGNLFVGGRYFSTEPTLTFELPLGVAGDVSTKDTRIDPFVGFEAGYDGIKWGFEVRGDIGGFGIGNAARFSWQLQPMAIYRFTGRMGLLFGYRLLSFDTVSGSGEEENGQDLLQHGPLIGASFKLF